MCKAKETTEMAYNRLVNCDPNDYQGNQIADLINLGCALEDQGKFNRAVEVYRKVVVLIQQDRNGPDAEAHYNLARALDAQGRHDEANLAYRRGHECYID